MVTVLASTPSDPRTIKNSISALRRAGIDVRASPVKKRTVASDRQSEALRARLRATIDAGFTVAELARHSTQTASEKGIRGFSSERSASVTLYRLRDGGRVAKWTHDLIAASLNDIETVRSPEPPPEAEEVIVASLPQYTPTEESDLHVLAVEWDGALESLERSVRLFRAATRRTFEELQRGRR